MKNIQPNIKKNINNLDCSIFTKCRWNQQFFHLRDFPRAQAIFHHISWLKSKYRHSQLQLQNCPSWRSILEELILRMLRQLENTGKYYICIRTRRGIYSQIYHFAGRSSRGGGGEYFTKNAFAHHHAFNFSSIKKFKFDSCWCFDMFYHPSFSFSKMSARISPICGCNSNWKIQILIV